MKAEYVKKPTGAEFIHITDMNEIMVERACREVWKMIPVMGDDNGSAYDQENQELKRKGGAAWLTRIFRDLEAQMLFSDCHKLVETVIEKASELDFMPESPLSTISMFRIDGMGPTSSILLSAYGDGDHYKAHEDRSILSMLLWVSDNEDFTGGNIHFTQFGEKIPPKKGTGVIFPSFYAHEVETVHTAPDMKARYTVTCFCA